MGGASHEGQSLGHLFQEDLLLFQIPFGLSLMSLHFCLLHCLLPVTPRHIHWPSALFLSNIGIIFAIS